MGMAKRYIIAIADSNRAPFDSFCAKLTAADFPCDVMRRGQMNSPRGARRSTCAVQELATAGNGRGLPTTEKFTDTSW
jgi:hypothetical protein